MGDLRYEFRMRPQQAHQAIGHCRLNDRSSLPPSHSPRAGAQRTIKRSLRQVQIESHAANFIGAEKPTLKACLYGCRCMYRINLTGTIELLPTGLASLILEPVNDVLSFTELDGYRIVRIDHRIRSADHADSGVLTHVQLSHPPQ